jgi:phosphate transport system substrate-binding protein
LYFYVKHQHVGVVPGIQEYMNEWIKHWGDNGALVDAGMIPMPQSRTRSNDQSNQRSSSLTADC